MDYATLLQILDSTLRLATPLLLACLAGLFSERSGIFDIGLEGKMLMAAMCTGAAAYLSGSVWVGVLAGIAGSMVLAGIHGLASITFRGNQLISGVALNFIASGITVLVAQSLFRQGGRTRGDRRRRGGTGGQHQQPAGEQQAADVLERGGRPSPAHRHHRTAGAAPRLRQGPGIRQAGGLCHRMAQLRVGRRRLGGIAVEPLARLAPQISQLDQALQRVRGRAVLLANIIVDI